MRFTITTLGCKVNQYESAAISAMLRRCGLVAAAAGQTADLVILNTCCVTATAMRKSRQALRRAVRSSPAAFIAVVGCYSDYDGRRISKLLESLRIPPEKTLIAGHYNDLIGCFARLPGVAEPHLKAAQSTDAIGYDECMSAGGVDCRHDASVPDTIKPRRQVAVKLNQPGASRLGSIDTFPGHQRAFVKVQEGCDAFCAYCIVSYTRPIVRSRSIDEIERECRSLVAAGHREIVLCGVFLGAFGRDTAIRRRWDGQPALLPQLVRRIASIEGLWRVRLSSLEPGDLTDELLAVYRDMPNVAPHLHLPLQSGSAAVLKRMNRQYTPDEFRLTVDRLRQTLNRPAITTDIIVGFPSETDADFAETLAVAAHAGFAKIHAFPFSAIEGTAAWTYRREAPPVEVVKARLAELAELEKRMADNYRRQFVGGRLEGIVEDTKPAPDLRQAMTDRYLTVTFPYGNGSDNNLTGSIVALEIDRVTDVGLQGRITNL